MQLRRETVKLRESTLAVEQLNSQVSMHKSLNDSTWNRAKQNTNARTFLESRPPQVEEFDIIEHPDDPRGESRNSRSVGGAGAYQSLRIPITEDPDNDDELRDQVPEGVLYCSSFGDTSGLGTDQFRMTEAESM